MEISYIVIIDDSNPYFWDKSTVWGFDCNVIWICNCYPIGCLDQ